MKPPDVRDDLQSGWFHRAADNAQEVVGRGDGIIPALFACCLDEAVIEFLALFQVGGSEIAKTQMPRADRPVQIRMAVAAMRDVAARQCRQHSKERDRDFMEHETAPRMQGQNRAHRPTNVSIFFLRPLDNWDQERLDHNRIDARDSTQPAGQLCDRRTPPPRILSPNHARR